MWHMIILLMVRNNLPLWTHPLTSHWKGCADQNQSVLSQFQTGSITLLCLVSNQKSLSSHCWGNCLMWGQAVEDSWDECSGSVEDRWLPCLLHFPQLSSPHPQEKTKSLMLLSVLARLPSYPMPRLLLTLSLWVSIFLMLSLNTHKQAYMLSHFTLNAHFFFTFPVSGLSIMSTSQI